MSTVISILNKYSTDNTPTGATATWSTRTGARGEQVYTEMCMCGTLYLKRFSLTGIQNVTVDIRLNCTLCQNKHLPFYVIVSAFVYIKYSMPCAQCFEVASAIEIGLLYVTS